MPRHHVFLCNLDALRKNFEATVGDFVDHITTVANASDRLAEYAEMAFGGAEKPWVTGYTKDTYRNLRQQAAATDLRTGLLGLESVRDRLAMPLADHVRGSTAAKFSWLLHAYKLAGADWTRELACNVPGEALAALQKGLETAFEAGGAAAAAFRLTGDLPEDLSQQDFPYLPSTGDVRILCEREARAFLDACGQIDAHQSVFPMPDDPSNLTMTPKVREILGKVHEGSVPSPVLLSFRR